MQYCLSCATMSLRNAFCLSARVHKQNISLHNNNNPTIKPSECHHKMLICILHTCAGLCYVAFGCASCVCVSRNCIVNTKIRRMAGDVYVSQFVRRQRQRAGLLRDKYTTSLLLRIANDRKSASSPAIRDTRVSVLRTASGIWRCVFQVIYFVYIIFKHIFFSKVNKSDVGVLSANCLCELIVNCQLVKVKSAHDWCVWRIWIA